VKGEDPGKGKSPAQPGVTHDNIDDDVVIEADSIPGSRPPPDDTPEAPKGESQATPPKNPGEPAPTPANPGETGATPNDPAR